MKYLYLLMALIPLIAGAQFLSTTMKQIDIIENNTGTNIELNPVTNILFKKAAINEVEAMFTEIATPTTPIVGLIKVYAKADKKVYTLDSDGIETEVGSGAGAPTTTIGDLSGHDGVDPQRIPVGLDGEFLVADSNEALGVKYTSSLSGAFNPVTDWETFTSTGTFNNTTYTGKSRRVGDSLEMQVTAEITGAITGGTSMRVNLPSGLVIDTDKLTSPSGNESIDGEFFATYNGFGRIIGLPVYVDTTTIGALIVGDQSGDNHVFSTATDTFPRADAIGDKYYFNIRVPIVGWSSGLNAVVEKKTLTKIYAEGNGSQGITANTEAIPFLEITDNDGSYTSNTIFTAKESGRYSYMGSLNHTASVTMAVRLWVNDSYYKAIGFNENAASDTGFAGEIDLLEGDTVKVTVTSGITLVNDTSAHRIAITQRPESIVLTGVFEKCQEKFLSADITVDTTDITDLRFSNLDVGKTYRVCSHVRASFPSASDNIDLTSVHNAVTVIANTVSSATNLVKKGNYCRGFTAAATTLTHNVSSLAAGNLVQGNGTVSETWIELCEISITTTTEW